MDYSDDALVAVQSATQMAEVLGEDMAIMSDLSTQPLTGAEGIVLEIVRCPDALKKNTLDLGGRLLTACGGVARSSMLPLSFHD